MNFLFFLLISVSPIALGAFAHSLGGGGYYILAYFLWITISAIGEAQRINLLGDDDG